MNDYGIKYDHNRYHPKEEDLKKLARSIQDAQGQEKHEIRCPICGFLEVYVHGKKEGLVVLKCSKCKYSGPMNLSYFRTMKPYRKHVKFEPWRFYPDKDK